MTAIGPRDGGELLEGTAEERWKHGLNVSYVCMGPAGRALHADSAGAMIGVLIFSKEHVMTDAATQTPPTGVRVVGAEGKGGDEGSEKQEAVTADELRWLAEEADGRRGEELVLAWAWVEADGKRKRKLTLQDAAKHEGADVGVQTPFDGDSLRGGKDVQLKLFYRKKEYDVDPRTDAIFLTQSAVEKFVLPYYTRFKSPWWIQGLKARLFGKTADAKGGPVIAAFHIPPSYTGPIIGAVVASVRSKGKDEDDVTFSDFTCEVPKNEEPTELNPR